VTLAPNGLIFIHDFGFEYDGDSAGWIESGEADELLLAGFIGSWRDALK